MAIHPTAIISPKAELDSRVEVGPYCVIEDHVRVAADCRFYQNVYLTGWTEIGASCVLHPGVVVGHEPQDTKYGGERSFCRVGAGTILREYVTIHRGAVPDSTTLVGSGCFLLAGSHVAHNCTLGDQVILTNGAMLGGHVEIGDRTNIGGATAIHQFVRIGESCMVAGSAAVVKDILPFAIVDRSGKIAGINRIGMRRTGMKPEEMANVRNTYRTLFGRGVPLSRGVRMLAEQSPCGAAGKILAFLESESRRGWAGRSRKAVSVETSHPK